MSEHGADPNAEYLADYPNAEVDPDRANTIGYARKEIDELAQIARQNGQDDVLKYLNDAADLKEKDEVIDYDSMKEYSENLLAEFTQDMISLAQDEGEGYKGLSHDNAGAKRLEPEEQIEAVDKFLNKLGADEPEQTFFTHNGGEEDVLEGRKTLNDSRNFSPTADWQNSTKVDVYDTPYGVKVMRTQPAVGPLNEEFKEGQLFFIGSRSTNLLDHVWR